jgi:putative Ca2+/H+ antiporter (TMEM165/GDT1 family)
MLAPETVSVSLSTFALIALAEMGDKSQLVCMTLAARHRHWPVLLGASVAFLLLNLLAVVFGAALANWLPASVVSIVVAVLFAGFGIHSLMQGDDDEQEGVAQASGRGIFMTTLLLIFVAEFGDKTQLAVAALAGRLNPLAVWIGASAALIVVSALGVWAGRTLLKRLPMVWLHRASGILFLLFAMVAIWPLIAG